MTLHIAEITFEQSKLRADNVQLVCRFDRFEGGLRCLDVAGHCLLFGYGSVSSALVAARFPVLRDSMSYLAPVVCPKFTLGTMQKVSFGVRVVSFAYLQLFIFICFRRRVVKKKSFHES